MSQLAIRLGTYKKTIYTWEHNIFVPGATNLIRIADFFDVSVDYVLYGNTEVKDRPTEVVGLLCRFRKLTGEQKKRVLEHLELTHAIMDLQVNNCGNGRIRQD